jgi:hypothetical protein
MRTTGFCEILYLVTSCVYFWTRGNASTISRIRTDMVKLNCSHSFKILTNTQNCRLTRFQAADIRLSTGFIRSPIGPIRNSPSDSLNSRSFFTATMAVCADAMWPFSTGHRSCTDHRVGANEVISAHVVCGGPADPCFASSLPVSRRSPDVRAPSWASYSVREGGQNIIGFLMQDEEACGGSGRQACV